MMKQRSEIEERINEVERKYRVTSDMYDPILEAQLKAQIRELKWVLKSETTEIEENCSNCKWFTCPVDEYPCIRCEDGSQWERNEKYISHDG